MPTQVSDKEAKATKKAAGLQRAKEWHEQKNGGACKSPTRKSPKKSSTSSSKNTPNKRQKTTPDLQYKKTPSQSSRKKMRAEARQKAKLWHNERQNNKTGVPAEVETGANKVEEDEISDDDFQTAQTQTDDNLKKELIELKKDVEVVFDRVKLLNEQFKSTVDAMDCN